MLSLTLFLPLLAGLAVLALPRERAGWIRWTALAGSGLALLLSAALWIGYDAVAGGLQWRNTAEWIPSLGASYDVAVDGLSLPLMVLTALLLTLCMVYVLPQRDRAKEHAFLLLLMGTGLLGVFAARDLLLFYLFFEVGLVPMYFLIGLWGHGRRRYSALKFFLYTRAGSLAMLLAFLALYLAMEPRTFSMDRILEAQPLAGSPAAAGLVLLGLVIGFGVKLPIVPLHNWLPDAHVDAPTEGSVMLAGVLLKLGAYGMIRLLPAVSEAASQYALALLAIGVLSALYGALTALAQSDLKRLVAYTSVNHMAYVTIGVAAAFLTTRPEVRELALGGAALQAVSHGLLTGGMFFMVGILQTGTGTRELDRLGGLLRRGPVCSLILALLIFGSLGLPGLSGFVAEFQVLGAALAVSLPAALLTVAGLVLTTALYLRVLVKVLLGEAGAEVPATLPLSARQAWAVVPLALLALALGLLPQAVVRTLQAGLGG